MNKLLFHTLLSVFTVTIMISCKKNHVCSCETTVNTNGIVGAYPAADSVINNKTTADASELCNAGDSQITQGGETVTINCDLK